MSCCGKTVEIESSNTVETPEEFYLNKESKSQQRLDICKSCPELKTLNVCGQCGCFMNIKTRIYWASCPLGKW